MELREPYFSQQERQNRLPAIQETNQDDPLSGYIGRTAAIPSYQRDNEITRPKPKTPLFEEFENLRQEMLVDARNNRTNKWAEDTRSRGNTRDRDERNRNRFGISEYVPPREASRDKKYTKVEIRDAPAPGSDLLEQIMFPEFSGGQGNLGEQIPKKSVSIHEVRDQLAFLNRVSSFHIRRSKVIPYPNSAHLTHYQRSNLC